MQRGNTEKEENRMCCNNFFQTLCALLKNCCGGCF